MKARLKIRNFGPINDLDIEISKFNILIGPHASGKSTISKVLCIIQSYADTFSPDFRPSKQKNGLGIWTPEEENYYLLKEFFINYRIENFSSDKTYFYFEDDFFLFELDGERIEIKHKNNEDAGRSQSYYIPAERIALPMISESLFELTQAQSTLPSYFLEFGKDFTLTKRIQKIFNIPLLKIGFEHKEGLNVVTLPDNKALLLEETSSAIQANLPLLVILQNPLKIASLFVIEELELHGFPTLQKELLHYIIERMKHPKLHDAYLMLPTHSPYILSATNNLLFAAKVGKQSDESATEADKIIRKGSWINKEDFSAYYVADGKATSIVKEKTGLIDENELDGISEDLASEFDALMDLYKPAIA